MEINEPVTVLTDYLLALGCFYFGARIFLDRPAAWSNVWAAAFLALAAAAVTGGTFHALDRAEEPFWSSLLWNSAVYFIGAGSALVVLAALTHPVRRLAGWLAVAIVITLAGLLVLAMRVSIHKHFNENDLYHLLQLGALYCLYRVARGTVHLRQVRD